MTKTGNKTKANDFERKICKQLSLWWSDYKDDDVFYRTASSGGRATTRARKGKKASANQCGDVGATGQEGEAFTKVFTTEIKRGYNRFTIQDCLDRADRAAVQVYQKWIDQAEESREAANSLGWLIIVRRKQRKTLAILPTEMLLRCGVMLNPPYITLNAPHKEGANGIVLLHLKSFLDKVTPKMIKELAESKV